MDCRESVAPGDGATGAPPCAAGRVTRWNLALALLALACVSIAAVPAAGTAAEDKPLKERLIGAWTFASSINTRKDGTTFDRWGPNPTGMLIFDGNGHFSQMITSLDRFFGAKTVASFGKYSVDETNKVIVVKIEGSTTSKAIGSTQRRAILSLTESELRYVNPLTATGHKAEVTWKRLQ